MCFDMDRAFAGPEAVAAKGQGRQLTRAGCLSDLERFLSADGANGAPGRPLELDRMAGASRAETLVEASRVQ
ncbi:hypothetical protein CVIRNUC_010138 [Coccomyxa viridis]|uniref:Uncharacterized protein n=1 Tax=Coccomyxa viridis TaxID=1274662 RepID=A0AAV1III6_9CHLO|nr:hypothetical protein CVIRNUC_010138 [Coccomyxa viridis]